MNWAIGGLCDWVAYLREATPVRLNSTDRTFFVPIESAVCSTPGAPTGWSVSGTYGLFGTTGDVLLIPVLTQSATALKWVWQLSDVLPKDGLLTSISIRLQGVPAWAALPSAMPVIYLVRVSSSMSVTRISSPVYDASVDVTAFKSDHTIEITGSLDLDTGSGPQSSRIYLVLEGAENSTWVDLFYYDIKATVTSKAWS
jgi:hypothetical protein